MRKYQCMKVGTRSPLAFHSSNLTGFHKHTDGGTNDRSYANGDPIVMLENI